MLCISQHPAGDRNRLGAILFLSQRLSVIYSSVANNNASVCVVCCFYVDQRMQYSNKRPLSWVRKTEGRESSVGEQVQIYEGKV